MTDKHEIHGTGAPSAPTQVRRSGITKNILNIVLNGLFLFYASCVSVEADPNKVNPTLFKIFCSIVIITCSLILIFATIILIVVSKSIIREEFPLFFNWCKRLFGR